jgi:hypothetical protein
MLAVLGVRVPNVFEDYTGFAECRRAIWPIISSSIMCDTMFGMRFGRILASHSTSDCKSTAAMRRSGHLGDLSFNGEFGKLSAIR